MVQQLQKSESPLIRDSEPPVQLQYLHSLHAISCVSSRHRACALRLHPLCLDLAEDIHESALEKPYLHVYYSRPTQQLHSVPYMPIFGRILVRRED